jgi:hypothetical protein
MLSAGDPGSVCMPLSGLSLVKARQRLSASSCSALVQGLCGCEGGEAAASGGPVYWTREQRDMIN